MSSVPIQMPRVSETIDESFVVEWLAAVGDTVEADQVLLRVETDKAIVDIPSTVSGVLVQRLAEIDDPVNTGATVAIIEETVASTQ